MDYLNQNNSFEEVEDMITLTNLTEESLLTNLRLRYSKKFIYTYTGSILVAVNPYEILPIYTPDIVKSYFGKQRGSLPPHIFAIADAAYTNMMEERKNQSIIISGESGAGKTESTKLIIQYLAARTNKHSQVEQMIVESSPILEAFGNAKTVRNNNSSRFGKFIEIQFNQTGHICGARIINYLLEKSRLTSQAQSERNYHIFYQLLAGASQEMKSKLQLGEPEEYHYLNQSGCIHIDRINDAEDFEHVRYAMSVLGLPEDKQNTIFTILGAILHLGNVQFEKCEKAQDSTRAEGSSVSSRDTFKIVADLLGVDANKLETCLTVRHVLIRGQNFVIPLKVGEAEDARDSFAKSLYGNVFNWLVTFINSRIHKPQPNTTFIGVLDIFGFENFKKNSFEQFCINFANEKLQQHFNQHIFKLEQEEYEKEKINWSKVTYNDNQECLDLIEKRPLGIFSLLDEECRFPQADDKSLLEKLHSNHEKHAYYEKPKRSKTTFVVKHYAGEVSYDTGGFLDKNKDTVSDDTLAFMQQCKNKFLVELFAPPKVDVNSEEDDGKGTMKKQVRHTAGSTFKTQLAALVATLSATAPHYVRCVKPNSTKEPNSFDDELVQAQLRYAGMMETIRIRKTGFPIRQTLREFRDRYILLEWRARDADPRKTAQNLINMINMSYDGVDAGEWQLGLSKVFIRDPQYRLLEDFRKAKLVTKVTLIQATWRMYRIKKKFAAICRASVLLQTMVRATVERKHFAAVCTAATRIQATWKMAKQRRVFLQTLENVRVLQNQVRSFLARKQCAAEVELKRERLERLAQIQAEKDGEERIKKEREERARTDKEDAVRAADQRKKEDEERKKKEQEERRKKEEEESKRAEEAKAQLKELNQFDEISSLETMLREKQQTNMEELDSMVHEFGEFSFEGGAQDDAAAYAYNPKMYEMSDDAIDKISLTDLLQGLKQTVRTVTKLEVDDDKFNLPPGIENVLKRMPPPTPLKGAAGRPSKANLMDEDVELGMPPPPPPPAFDDAFMPPPPPPSMDDDYSMPPPPPPIDFTVLTAFDPILGAPPPPPPVRGETGGSASQAGSAPAPQVPVAKQVDPKLANLRPVINDEEISLYSFYDYARKNFAPNPKQKDDLYAYQKSFIKHPLIAQPDSELAKSAVDAFGKLQSYLLAPPTAAGSKKEESLFATARHILAKGLALEGLRDELYCQLVKQSISTPTLEIRTRAWELLHFAAATFQPSKRLIKYVASYIKGTANTESVKSIREVAQATYVTLQRHVQNGARKMAPSTNELEALRESRPLFVRVSMCDGSLKGLTIDSATTAQEAIEDLCHRARLRAAKVNGFGLVESFNGIERDLLADDKLTDVLAKLESLQASKLTINFKLLFKKRLFAEFGGEEAPSTERELVFHQIYNDLLSTTYMVNIDTQIAIGAIRLQMDSGDVTEDVLSWLPGNGRAKYFTAAIEKSHFDDFVAKYRSLKGVSQEDAKTRAHEMVMGHPLANHTLFACEHTTDGVNYPRNFIVALDIHGISIIDPAHMDKPLVLVKYGQLSVNSLKISANNKSLTIPLPESKVQFEIMHGDASRILSCIKDYATTLRNNAKYARALRDYFVNDDTLLPFRRNDIITIVLKDQENKWYIGQLNGREGSFPVDHVEILLVDNIANIPAVGTTASPAVSSPAFSSPSGASSPLPPPPPSFVPHPPSGLASSGGDIPPPPSMMPPPPAMLPIPASQGLGSSGDSTPPPPPPPVTVSVPTGPPPPMLSTPIGLSPNPSRRSATLVSPLAPPPPPQPVAAPVGPAPPMLSTPVGLSPNPSRLSTPPPPPQTSSVPEAPSLPERPVSRIQTMAPLETVNPLESNMTNWANNKFRSFKRHSQMPANSTIKKKPVDPNTSVCFTKDPIKESLLDLETSKLSKRAVSNFTSVMAYMGDYPLPKTSNASLVAQEIIELGIESPELRDEIYCQVYRQTNRNPRPESVRRAFELLCFLATTFAPSESLLSPFVEQLMARHIAIQTSNPTLSPLILQVIERLESYPLSPAHQRRCGPSTAEINALRALGSGEEAATINVRAVTQSAVSVALNSYSNVMEVASAALHQLGVTPAAARHFGLYQVNEAAGICRPLGDADIIYDILAQWEQWALAGDSKNVLLDNFYLQVRRKYYVDDITRILDQEYLWTTDETSFDLTVTQLREEWLRGVYTLGEKEASNAAAILVQLAHPNQSKLQLSTKESLRPFMSEVLIQSQNIKYWSSAIESLLFELVSHTPEYLKLLFIQLLGKSPLFGCTLFNVAPKDGAKAILGISKKGVYLFDASTRETRSYWTFQSISNWSYTDNTFIVMTGNLMKPVKNTFTTTDYSAISSCYQFYSS